MRKIGRLSVLAATAGGAIAGYVIASEENRKTALASWTTGYTPSVKWDWNWDRRGVHSLVKPPKSKGDENNNNLDGHDDRYEKVRPTASRHLIFIRHGQYNLEGPTDHERYLTSLGREQAALTGLRLQELTYPYSRVVYSTMTRATETAEIILKKLENVEVIERCDLLREGAPIPPEPPIGSWKPEMHSSQLPPEAWLRLTLHNGSITHLVVRPDGRVGLWQLGECGYMPPENSLEHRAISLSILLQCALCVQTMLETMKILN
ncbi:putative serine/threonine-protein phosphatase PGAM5, mitochondrial isoform X2 [Penaeus vannamei]|uniref:Serine/threonine-protein phosphatase PGAM5, mitochondrial n=1 Tax=Penaeus vannamei TaxID=6689 RepID=A0A423SBM4_PENVA|nr:putative serine/threonine-protein phosphatase PGAM5, mitochondrial isoform X2 [Penaeus vannamei]